MEKEDATWAMKHRRISGIVRARWHFQSLLHIHQIITFFVSRTRSSTDERVSDFSMRNSPFAKQTAGLFADILAHGIRTNNSRRLISF